MTAERCDAAAVGRRQLGCAQHQIGAQTQQVRASVGPLAALTVRGAWKWAVASTAAGAPLSGAGYLLSPLTKCRPTPPKRPAAPTTIRDDWHRRTSRSHAGRTMLRMRRVVTCMTSRGTVATRLPVVSWPRIVRRRDEEAIVAKWLIGLAVGVVAAIAAVFTTFLHGMRTKNALRAGPRASFQPGGDQPARPPLGRAAGRLGFGDPPCRPGVWPCLRDAGRSARRGRRIPDRACLTDPAPIGCATSSPTARRRSSTRAARWRWTSRKSSPRRPSSPTCPSRSNVRSGCSGSISASACGPAPTRYRAHRPDASPALPVDAQHSGRCGNGSSGRRSAATKAICPGSVATTSTRPAIGDDHTQPSPNSGLTS